MYRRLIIEERVRISELLHAGWRRSEIAREMGRSVSTISREIQRGWTAKKGRIYSPWRGQMSARFAAQDRRSGKSKILLSAPLRRLVDKLLRKHWSPEQIAAVLKAKYGDRASMTISHESIYRYVYVHARGSLKKELVSCLRQKKGSRRIRGRKRAYKRGIPDLVSIDHRPDDVANRTIPGHWEGDLLIGRRHKSAMGTLVERTTRTVLLVPLNSRSPRKVAHAFARELKRLPEQMRLTLTYDQGSEMREHILFTEQTKMQVYFCHPSSPWERGTCENTNMLIRDFFPKETDFTQISRREAKMVQRLLNDRPRKTLSWETPRQRMQKLLALNA